MVHLVLKSRFGDLCNNLSVIGNEEKWRVDAISDAGNTIEKINKPRIKVIQMLFPDESLF